MWLAILAFALLGLSACSDEAKDQVGQAIDGSDTASTGDTGGESAPATDPPATDPPATDPPATDPPATDPPATEAPSSGEDAGTTDDAMTTEEWILLGILAVAAIALIVGATSAAHNHSEKKAAAQAERNRTIGQVVGTSRWVHDQGSVEILRQSDPAQLDRSWDDVRGRMVDLEAQIATTRTSTDDAALERALGSLGQAVAGLRGALSSYVALRTGPDAGSQTDLIQDATQTARATPTTAGCDRPGRRGTAMNAARAVRRSPGHIRGPEPERGIEAT